MWRYGGLPGERAAARRPAWRSLRARLAALVFCAVAAGGGAITAAGHLTAQDYLTQQADRQLRSYAGLLTARPFTIFPGFRLAPGASGLGTADRELAVAVRSSGGQLLMSAGPAAPPARAAGRGWLEISEPVGYRADHIPFVYGADNFSVSVTPRPRPGLTGTAGTAGSAGLTGTAGTLVIGLNLAGVSRAVGNLTVIGLAVTALSVLLAAAAATTVTGRLLRPLAQSAEKNAQQQAAAAAAAARATCAAVAGTCVKMRRPLSVLAGLAEYHRARGGRGADDTADADRMMRQVAQEAARMAELVDALEDAAGTEPHKTRWPPPARP